MGSIPPAGSIEYPQREIVNFIGKSNLVPTDYDLFQLAKAVQSGAVNYGVDVGPANDLQITPVVPIANYSPGQRFMVKVNMTNTSQSTLNVNGIGKVPLLHTDLTPLNAGELISGQLAEVAHDGANFQVVAGVTAGGLVVLSAPRTVYLDANIGDDVLYDGTSPTVSTAGAGPFKTFDQAVATMRKYNLGGWDFNIIFADGVYPRTTALEVPASNGSGTINVIGNAASPSSVSIFNAGTGTSWRFRSGGVWNLTGLSFSVTAPAPGDDGYGIWVAGATNMTLTNINWGQVTASHILCGPSGSCLIVGNQNIVGGVTNAHHQAYANGALLCYSAGPNTEPILTIVNNVSIPGGFTSASSGGQARSLWRTITGASKVTGPKYKAFGNGVIDAQGRGASYLPGTTVGVLQTGGQYL